MIKQFTANLQLFWGNILIVQTWKPSWSSIQVTPKSKRPLYYTDTWKWGLEQNQENDSREYVLPIYTKEFFYCYKHILVKVLIRDFFLAQNS